MENISLKQATIQDKTLVIDIDYKLDKVEHINLKREEKLTKAISNNECFVILSENKPVGFLVFDYRFFDQGWIDLIIIGEQHRDKGIGSEAMKQICMVSKTKKVFTSTNRSNILMQNALRKSGFSFAGEIIGLDEGDPELFYFKEKKIVSLL